MDIGLHLACASSNAVLTPMIHGRDMLSNIVMSCAATVTRRSPSSEPRIFVCANGLFRSLEHSLTRHKADHVSRYNVYSYSS